MRCFRFRLSIRKIKFKNVLDWAKEVVERGAGEILLTSMDRDGTKDGYDIPLTKTISDAIQVPVIASGGVGNPMHMSEGILEGSASAVLAASIFHFGEYTVSDVKNYLESEGLPVRPA